MNSQVIAANEQQADTMPPQKTSTNPSSLMQSKLKMHSGESVIENLIAEPTESLNCASESEKNAKKLRAMLAEEEEDYNDI